MCPNGYRPSALTLFSLSHSVFGNNLPVSSAQPVVGCDQFHLLTFHRNQYLLKCTYMYTTSLCSRCCFEPYQSKLPREQRKAFLYQGYPSIWSVVLKHQGPEPSEHKCKNSSVIDKTI